MWWRYYASSIIKMAASSVFDLNHIAAFGISRRTGVPNFIQIAPSSADLICHIDFLRWRSLWNNFTSVLGFGDNTFFRRSMYINIPNIVSMARGYAYAKIEYIRIRPYLLKTRIRVWYVSYANLNIPWPIRSLTSETTKRFCKVVKKTAWFNATIVTNNSRNCLPSLLLF